MSGKVDAKCEQVKDVRVPPNAAKVPLTSLEKKIHIVLKDFEALS